MKDPNNPCLFCVINKKEIVDENKLAYTSFDSYPVSKQHCLIIPKRHINDYFKLTKDEIIACNQLIKNIKNKIENNDKSVKGFNIGINSGKEAGQTIFQMHIHLIPRYKGDVNDPTGGVRGVIPSKKEY